jgi:uncharacterized protein YndB with AHSA1/START domain
MRAKVLIVERIFNASKKAVWRALTEKDLMKQWYFNLKEFKAELGFQFEFTGGPENGVQYKHVCEITEVIPEQKLSYSWKYEGYTGISHVSFELFEENNTTKLTLTHSGIESFPVEITDFAYSNFEEGWNHIINTSLKDFLEKK